MKVIILAGGFGTRLGEYTDVIPKPMLTIGGRPILWHIMQTYAQFGHTDFYLALGYKAELIKTYFLNFFSDNAIGYIYIAFIFLTSAQLSISIYWYWFNPDTL